MKEYRIPENEYPIDEIYAALSIDKDGNEGIVSMIDEFGSHPLVFGNPAMIEMIKQVITQITKDTGQTIRLCKFKRTEVIDTISMAN